MVQFREYHQAVFHVIVLSRDEFGGLCEFLLSGLSHQCLDLTHTVATNDVKLRLPQIGSYL